MLEQIPGTQAPFEQIDSAEVWQRLRGRLNVRAGAPSVANLALSVQPTVAIEPLLGITRVGYWTTAVTADAQYTYATVPNNEMWHLGAWRFAPADGTYNSNFRLLLPDYDDPSTQRTLQLHVGGGTGTAVFGDLTGTLLRPGDSLATGVTTGYSSPGTNEIYIILQVEDISS